MTPCAATGPGSRTATGSWTCWTPCWPKARSTRPPMTPPRPRRWCSPTATPIWATMSAPRRRTTKSPPWSAPPTTPISPTRSSPTWRRSLWSSSASPMIRQTPTATSAPPLKRPSARFITAGTRSTPPRIPRSRILRSPCLKTPTMRTTPTPRASPSRPPSPLWTPIPATWWPW